MAALECSQAGQGHPQHHPPTHNSEPRQNIEMFLDSLNILPVRQALYCVRDPRNSFIQYRQSHNFIEMLLTDYITPVWDEK